MCTCIQNFDSVASHLELAILSRKFRITEHAQSSAVEYFNFFSTEINLSLQDLHLHQVMAGENYQESETQTLTLPMICPRKFYF